MIPKHYLYKKYVRQWVKIRDVIEGQEAIKDKNTLYLPKLSGQTDTEYAAYLLRALFMGITSRIVTSNIGMITRRLPITEYPDNMKYLFIDSLGFRSFNEIFKYVVSELLMMGRVALLIDTKDNKPVILRYSTEAIVDWFRNSNGILTDVILKADIVDEFRASSNITYFHLKLRDGKYIIDELNDSGTSIKTTVPTIKGKSIDFIPFICATTTGLDINPVKSPIIDIVDINLSHYLSSADLENGRHFTALPTPIVTGSTSDEDLRIGSSIAWILPDAKSKAYYLEFQGQGLQSLEKALAEKQAQISQFNANLMDTSTRGSEAENVVQLRHASDAATLSDIADATESTLRLTYSIAALFLGLEINKVKVKVSRNFLETKLSHAELTALTKAFLDGAIDKQTLTYNLSRGEMYDPTKPISGGD